MAAACGGNRPAKGGLPPQRASRADLWWFLALQILTKDSVAVTVDAVVYWRISNPMIAVTNVENYSRSTQLLAQTTLRNMLGTRTLSEVLSERNTVSEQMQVIHGTKHHMDN